MERCLLCLALLAAAGGCQRPWYRNDADREVYTAERQHEDDSLWAVAAHVVSRRIKACA
jgi:hypothetical protein